MSTKVITEVKEIVDHPLEDFFGIESTSTEIVSIQQKTSLSEHENYDEKDAEIENDFQEIYDIALSGYKELQETIEDTDGKYRARVQEVANQLLGTALNAAKEKADLKKNKDKIVNSAKTTSPSTVNNTVIMDTNDLIQHLKKINKVTEAKVVEATVISNEIEEKK